MGKTILIVDDDKSSVEVVRNMLVEKDYAVIDASDGSEGIDAVREKSPDLILLDIRMPTMNGYEFIRALRSYCTQENQPMVPVIMLTGIEEMKEVFKLEGAKGYITKPVKQDELVEKIEECLNSNE